MTLSDLRITNAVQDKAHAKIAGDMYYDDSDDCIYVIGNGGQHLKLSSSPGSYEHDSIEEALRSR